MSLLSVMHSSELCSLPLFYGGKAQFDVNTGFVLNTVKSLLDIREQVPGTKPVKTLEVNVMMDRR